MANYQAVQNKIDECLTKLQEAGYPVPTPIIKYDLRGKCAGQAIKTAQGVYKVRINKEALEVYPEDTINQTVPHEIAHLAQFRHYPMSKGHGSAWKGFMKVLDVKPKRCHSLKLSPARKTKTYKHSCSCTTYKLSSIRHNRMLRGTVYRCNKCGDKLV